MRHRCVPFGLRRACVLAALFVSALLVAIDATLAQSQRRSGDVLATAMPVATLGTELFRGDREGAWQYTLTFVASSAGTELLKRTIHVERPDGSNDESFPSGHAARAFSAAAYVRRRHGWDAAWPMYVAALYVGHTRVAAHRHRWGDVAGAALLSEAAARWLVDPSADAKVVVTPALDRRYVGVQIDARW
jgi:membrane-associated phospholipid phosphatase